MTRRRFIFSVLTLPGFAFGQQASVDWVVIVHRENQREIDRAIINRLYMYLMPKWEDGSPIELYTMDEAHPLRVSFDEVALGRSSAQTKALWAMLLIRGRGTPPKMVNSEQDMVKAVAATPGAIGFVSAVAAQKASGVRIIRIKE
jgi:ABC-type phosphate transport system substrate-binding protein